MKTITLQSLTVLNMTVFLNGKRYFAYLTVFLWRCCKMTVLFKRLMVFRFWTVPPSAVRGLPKYDGIPPSTGTDVQHGKITSEIFPRTTLIFSRRYVVVRRMHQYRFGTSWANSRFELSIYFWRRSELRQLWCKRVPPLVRWWFFPGVFLMYHVWFVGDFPWGIPQL